MVKTLVSRFFAMGISDLVKFDWDTLPVVQEEDPVDMVLDALRSSDHLWVVEGAESRLLTGVITEKDFLGILAPPNLSGFVFGMPDIRSLGLGTVETASDIMTRKVITSRKEDRIEDIIEKMRSYRVRSFQ